MNERAGALIFGAGGVGYATVQALLNADGSRGKSVDFIGVADYSLSAATKLASLLGTTAYRCDARDPSEVINLLKDANPALLVNLVDPRFNRLLGYLCARHCIDYLDTAMSPSLVQGGKHVIDLGAKQKNLFKAAAYRNEQNKIGCRPSHIIGAGIEPGTVNVLVAHALKEDFSSIHDITILDGSNLQLAGSEYPIAPPFSPATMIEECLSYAYKVDESGQIVSVPPLTEGGIYTLPGGIGPQQTYLIEHEEVLMIRRLFESLDLPIPTISFKMGIDPPMLKFLQTLQRTGLGSNNVSIKDVNLNSILAQLGTTNNLTEEDMRLLLDVLHMGKIDSQLAESGRIRSARDYTVAHLPTPRDLNDLMTGTTCAGVLITGKGTQGETVSYYYYHKLDDRESKIRTGQQPVIGQTGMAVATALVARKNDKRWRVPGYHHIDELPPGSYLAASRSIMGPIYRASYDATTSSYNKQVQIN